MWFEHYSQPVLSHHRWIGRVAQSIWFAVLIAGTMLIVGIAGYHWLGGLPLVDAILEASMILGGMGPVAPLNGDAIKLFASVYALLSGLVIISMTGILLAPWLHRMMHYFYRERRHGSRGGERRRTTDKH